MQSLVDFCCLGFERLLTLKDVSLPSIGGKGKHKLLFRGVIQIYLLSSVWRLHKSLLETRKLENTLEISHWRETVCLWARRLQQGLLECFRSCQAPKQNTFQWGKASPGDTLGAQRLWVETVNLHGDHTWRESWARSILWPFPAREHQWCRWRPGALSWGWKLGLIWRGMPMKRELLKPTGKQVLLFFTTATYWSNSRSI